MNRIAEYNSSEEFAKGVDYMNGKGWILDSWQMVVVRYDSHDKLVIVAVFRGRHV